MPHAFLYPWPWPQQTFRADPDLPPPRHPLAEASEVLAGEEEEEDMKVKEVKDRPTRGRVAEGPKGPRPT